MLFLIVKRIIKNPEKYDDSFKSRILKSAKTIKELFLPEFNSYFSFAARVI